MPGGHHHEHHHARLRPIRARVVTRSPAGSRRPRRPLRRTLSRTSPHARAIHASRPCSSRHTIDADLVRVVVRQLVRGTSVGLGVIVPLSARGERGQRSTQRTKNQEQEERRRSRKQETKIKDKINNEEQEARSKSPAIRQTHRYRHTGAAGRAGPAVPRRRPVVRLVLSGGCSAWFQEATATPRSRQYVPHRLVSGDIATHAWSFQG